VNGRRTRAALAQNFFRRSKTVKAFVRTAGLVSTDLVYDLGAGSGMIARELAASGARVVAVECDPNLARALREQFAGSNVDVLEADLRGIAFDAPFKVVANIPFNLTSAILRRLYFREPTPCEALIVVQREAAEKYAGSNRKTAVSLMLRPWFDLSIVRAFEPHDFVPRPQVDIVLLRIVRKSQALLSELERGTWDAFVLYAHRRSKPDARTTFRNVVSNLQWRLLSRDLGVAPDVRLDELTIEHWVAIYNFVRRAVPDRKARLAFERDVRS
jgi:16S rRNA A1518/A1519 N6-dimethyltransferase RsmA/KsgA/DIM1 with predicted DNA glycosylase/AP lyase activity